MISDHEPFEELCAIAAAGEISTADAARLSAHVSECSNCRALWADLCEIHAQWFPERDEFEIRRQPELDQRLRTAILKRASRVGRNFSRTAQVGHVESDRGRRLQWIGVAALVLLSTAAAWAFFSHRDWRKASRHPNSSIAVNQPISYQRDDPSRVDTTEQELARVQLERSETERTKLRRQLEEAEQRANNMAQSSNESAYEIDRLKRRLNAAIANEESQRLEISQLRSVQGASDAINISQQQEILRLNSKLNEQASNLDRERQMLAAGREIRDLIAARNLHIIDVYDTDSHGKTSPAFGRVFYTEGKSLIFYAYDLNTQKVDSGKLAFYVWGKRDGVPQDIRNLGQLSKDDHAQQRWVFTITDPKILEQIDSVFVTLEPAGRLGRKPSGKQLLSAFLGSPVNHP